MNIDKMVEGILQESGPSSRKRTTKRKSRLQEDTGVITQGEPKRKVERNYLQYIKSGNGNSFQPAGEIKLVDSLEPCSYEARRTMDGIVFEKVDTRTDNLLMFENSRMERVIEEIDKFWSLKPNFDKLGLLHNRGILCYGPPGTGKTAMISQVTERMISNNETVLFGKDIGTVTEALHTFREIEPDRKMVVILEDMDEYIGYSERDTLQLLDGSSSVDNVLFLGTTNYIEKFPPRLRRPGRFDKEVKIGFPPVEGRMVYLNDKLGDLVEKDEIQRLADETEGFSFGHLRELVIAGFAFEEDLDKTIKRLRKVSYPDLPEREEDEVYESLKKTVGWSKSLHLTESLFN